MFYSMSAQAAVMGVFTAMSAATGQYFLKQINGNLREINQKIDTILEFLYGDKKAELLSEISFTQYAYQNYSSIMMHEQQQTAMIASLQEARKVAIKDIANFLHLCIVFIADKLIKFFQDTILLRFELSP